MNNLKTDILNYLREPSYIHFLFVIMHTEDEVTPYINEFNIHFTGTYHYKRVKDLEYAYTLGMYIEKGQGNKDLIRYDSLNQALRGSKWVIRYFPDDTVRYLAGLPSYVLEDVSTDILEEFQHRFGEDIPVAVVVTEYLI